MSVGLTLGKAQKASDCRLARPRGRREQMGRRKFPRRWTPSVFEDLEKVHLSRVLPGHPALWAGRWAEETFFENGGLETGILHLLLADGQSRGLTFGHYEGSLIWHMFGEGKKYVSGGPRDLFTVFDVALPFVGLLGAANATER